MRYKMNRERLTMRVCNFDWDMANFTATFEDNEGNRYTDPCYTGESYGEGDVIEVSFSYWEGDDTDRMVESVWMDG